MNYEKFIKTYIGKSFDYDSVAGVQCVDFVKMYLDKVFDIKPGSWGNAKDYYENYNNLPLRTSFTRIVNSSSFIPKKGDIVIWGTAIGNKYGHIAIATGDGDINQFYSHDLNWNNKIVHKVLHNYKGFLGVLRPNDQTKIIEGNDEPVRKYINGSTREIVFADTNCTTEIGSLNPREECDCLGIFNNKAIVRYPISTTNNFKIGFCKWLGGVQ